MKNADDDDNNDNDDNDEGLNYSPRRNLFRRGQKESEKEVMKSLLIYKDGRTDSQMPPFSLAVGASGCSDGRTLTFAWVGEKDVRRSSFSTKSNMPRNLQKAKYRWEITGDYSL